MRTIEKESPTHNGQGAGIERSTYPTRPRNRLGRYGPVILWAGIIFIASTGLGSSSNTGTILHWLFPHLGEATLGSIHFLIRKSAHFTGYFIFALLAARAFRTSTREFLSSHWFLASLLLVVAYSLSDEFHQSFVPSRTASIYDSMIDSFGGLTALVVLLAFRRRRRPF